MASTIPKLAYMSYFHSNIKERECMCINPQVKAGRAQGTAHKAMPKCRCHYDPSTLSTVHFVPAALCFLLLSNEVIHLQKISTWNIHELRDNFYHPWRVLFFGLFIISKAQVYGN